MSDTPSSAGTTLTFQTLLTEKAKIVRHKPTLEIVPHPKAPLFSTKDGGIRLEALADVMEQGKIKSDDMREVIRQAGYVSLWFFLKFVAGYSNAFDLLNYDLHLDMCNYRQTLLEDGCRGAMFIPRGHYKSTVVTEGGSAWEILRSPDIRIRITNATQPKAAGFMHTVKSIFDSNDFVRWLYPEYCPNRSTPRWNDTEIVMPNRSRTMREGTVEAGGTGGASEGHHYDLHIIDDIVGFGDLNALHQTGTTMTQAKNWFWASEKTLLVSMKKSRVILVGTRYAIDDVYDDIIRRAYRIDGRALPGWTPNPKGRWRVYYRKGIEDGQVIFPENFSIEAYQEMAEDDWWTFVTQYLNDPQQAGLAEFSSFQLKKCWLDYNSRDDMWFILYYPEGMAQEIQREPLVDFDLIISIDPAATESSLSARTSRSAVGVLATHHTGLKFLIETRAEVTSITNVRDWVFEFAQKYKNYLRATYLEANAGFKLLVPMFREEERKRGIWINLRDFPAVGNKDARIRSNLHKEFEGGRMYVAEPYLPLIEEEQKAFPQSFKKDILDMLSNAVANSIRPDSPEEVERANQQDLLTTYKITSIAGY